MRRYIVGGLAVLFLLLAIIDLRQRAWRTGFASLMLAIIHLLLFGGKS